MWTHPSYLNFMPSCSSSGIRFCFCVVFIKFNVAIFHNIYMYIAKKMFFLLITILHVQLYNSLVASMNLVIKIIFEWEILQAKPRVWKFQYFRTFQLCISLFFELFFFVNDLESNVTNFACKNKYNLSTVSNVDYIFVNWHTHTFYASLKIQVETKRKITRKQRI